MSNRDLAFPRSVLQFMIGQCGDEQKRAGLELACKILDMYEQFDTIELCEMTEDADGGWTPPLG